MLDEIKLCVDAKINFFAEYFTIPYGLEEEITRFADDTTILGESCSSAVEFEEKFVSSGLSERFNVLIPKCTPKAKKLTKEDRRNSLRITKEILSENKNEIARDATLDIAGHAVVAQKDKQLNENRERMIADGTYAENTIRRNNVDNAVSLGRFFRNLFKK